MKTLSMLLLVLCLAGRLDAAEVYHRDGKGIAELQNAQNARQQTAIMERQAVIRELRLRHQARQQMIFGLSLFARETQLNDREATYQQRQLDDEQASLELEEQRLTLEAERTRLQALQAYKQNKERVARELDRIVQSSRRPVAKPQTHATPPQMRPITNGMSKAEVLSILGEPTGYVSISSRNTETLIYDSRMIDLADGRVTGRDQKPVPGEQQESGQATSRGTERSTVVPYKNDELGFSIGIPRSWHTSKITLAQAFAPDYVTIQQVDTPAGEGLTAVHKGKLQWLVVVVAGRQKNPIMETCEAYIGGAQMIDKTYRASQPQQVSLSAVKAPCVYFREQKAVGNAEEKGLVIMIPHENGYFLMLQFRADPDSFDLEENWRSWWKIAHSLTVFRTLPPPSEEKHVLKGRFETNPADAGLALHNALWAQGQPFTIHFVTRHLRHRRSALTPALALSPALC